MADREKSASYPSITIKECLDFSKVVDSFKTKTVAYRTVAEKYGLTSTTTKSFTQKIGSAKQYGLITTSNSTIQLTDKAREILYPTSNDSVEMELECFEMPPLYRVLIEEYEGKAIPEEQILANLLMSKYKISRAAKDTAARVFIKNADDLGLIKAGVFSCHIEDGVDLTEKRTSKVESTATEDDGQNSADSIIGAEETLKAEYITQFYPVESGKIAKLVIPVDATEDDLYAIRDLLEVVMRRKFKIKLDD